MDYNPYSVVARPKGGKASKGSITTTAAYQSVTNYIVSNGKTFSLSKTLVSCDEGVWVKVTWGGATISPEICIAGKVPFPDWYPHKYHDIVGDGTKKVEIYAKYLSGGSAGTCHAEILGEEK